MAHEIVGEMIEDSRSEGLGTDIGYHVIRRKIEEINLLINDSFTERCNTKVEMLDLTGIHFVEQSFDGRGIVLSDRGSVRKRTPLIIAEFEHEVAGPLEVRKKKLACSEEFGVC